MLLFGILKVTWPLAVLTGDRTIKVFYIYIYIYIRTCVSVSPSEKGVAVTTKRRGRITVVAVRRSFTVFIRRSPKPNRILDACKT